MNLDIAQSLIAVATAEAAKRDFCVSVAVLDASVHPFPFTIGTTEFVIVGANPEMADDLGVPLTTAGLLVSLYALAITLGAVSIAGLMLFLPRGIAHAPHAGLSRRQIFCIIGGGCVGVGAVDSNSTTNS